MAAAWGNKTAATQLTNITTEQFFDQTPKLEPNQVAHCQVEANFPATPTDDLIVSVYGTLDDATHDWDEVPLMQFRISKDIDPSDVSFTVFGVYRFRIGVKRSGTTDTIASSDFSYRIGTMA